MSNFIPVAIEAEYEDGTTLQLRAMTEEDFVKLMKELRESRAWIRAVRKLHGLKDEKPRPSPVEPKRGKKPI